MSAEEIRRNTNVFIDALERSRERTRLMVERGVWPPETLLGCVPPTVYRVRFPEEMRAGALDRRWFKSRDCKRTDWTNPAGPTPRRPSRMTPGRRMFVLALILAASLVAYGANEIRLVETRAADTAAAHAEAREALAVRTLELLQVMCLKGLPYPVEVTGGKHGVTRWPACAEIVPAAPGKAGR